jgi:hypothetical protein
MNVERLIDPQKLRADIAERLDCVRDVWGNETEPLTVGNRDGQIYVLERLLSDIDFGLWKANNKEKI